MQHQFGAEARVTLTIGDAGIAQVRLNRPEKLNALDLGMFHALAEAGSALHALPGLRAVVLAGEGKAFCAGLDLSAMAELTGPDGPPLLERSHGNANLFQQAAMVWRKLPVPVIAAIHGACLGGGLQIAGGADIRVAAPDARLAVMEAKWGLVPDMGGFLLWRDCVRADVLRELTWTARVFSGEAAQAMGFVTSTDPDPLARATAIAREIAARSPHATRAAKALFNRLSGLSDDAILIEESLAQHALAGSRNQLESVRSQMENREADFVDP